MNRTLLLLCSIILLCLATTARAANITAASCSSSDLQAAINSAATRDTVIVPPGNCTWTSTVTIASKALTLTGAGIGQTNITDQATGFAGLLIAASATNFVDVSGFTFIKDTAHANGIILIGGNTPFTDVAFRFHHNRILQATSGSRGIYVSGVYGLIDHNTFDVTATSGSIQSISIDGSSMSSDGGYTPWQQPLTLGTNKAVYVEDNTFTYNTSDTGVEDALDAYSGARFVVRYNRINNISMGHHGTDSGGVRSPVSYEVYNNTFTNNSTTRIRGWTVRGGTGVFFNNTYGGTVPSGWYGITLAYYRACGVLSNWQKCDGTNWELGSASLSSDLSRICSTTGGVRFDATDNETLGRAGGNFTRYFDGSGKGGYPCRDQPGRGPGQVLAPIYFWNNTGMTFGAYDGGDAGNCNGLGVANYILSGRDFIDNGITPKPGYTPYTYPHPLQAVQSNTTALAAPTGLTVK